MPPKRRSKKAVSAKKTPSAPSRPSTSQRFDHIEHLLQSLQAPGAAASSLKKQGAASASSPPPSKSPAKSSKHQKKSALQESESEDAIEEQEDPQGNPLGDLQSQFTGAETSLSDDFDTSVFLEHVKALAAQKKKAESTRIARANKRTIAEMEKDALALKVLTSQEIGRLTKGVLEESNKQEKPLAQLASETKRYQAESKRVRAGVETGLKELLEEVTEFSRKMDAVGKDFERRCKEIDAKMKAEVEKEESRIEKAMAKRSKTDRQLEKVVDFLMTQERETNGAL